MNEIRISLDVLALRKLFAGQIVNYGGESPDPFTLEYVFDDGTKWPPVKISLQDMDFEAIHNAVPGGKWSDVGFSESACAWTVRCIYCQKESPLGLGKSHMDAVREARVQAMRLEWEPRDMFKSTAMACADCVKTGF